MLCNEFDPCREAVINPADHYAPIEGFPKLCIGIFLMSLWRKWWRNITGGHSADQIFAQDCRSTALRREGSEAALFLPHVGLRQPAASLKIWLPGAAGICVLRLLQS